MNRHRVFTRILWEQTIFMMTQGRGVCKAQLLAYGKQSAGYASAVFLAVALLVLAPSVDGAVTINFDQLTSMSFLGGTVPTGARLSNQLQPTTGAVFSSLNGANFVAVVDLEVGAPSASAPTKPNGIGSVTAPGSLNYGLPIKISFFDPLAPATQSVTNFVSITGDLRSIAGDIILKAYDINGSLLATDIKPDNPGGRVVSISTPNIHFITVESTSGTVAFDTLSFNALRSVRIWIKVDPRTTYLRAPYLTVSGDEKVIRLSSLGINTGDVIRLERFGDFVRWPGFGDDFSEMIGVFSTDNAVLPPQFHHRVPGAVKSGTDFVTNPVPPGLLVSDIREDFQILSSTQGSTNLVKVPKTAKYLLIAAHDSDYHDNTDPDGDFGVVITPKIESGQISGYIMDEWDNGQGNVLVWYYKNGMRTETRTAASGRYMFVGLPDGSYNIRSRNPYTNSIVYSEIGRIAQTKPWGSHVNVNIKIFPGL